MNKLFMGAAAAALILSSCSNKDILDGPNRPGDNEGKVKFSAINDLNTKAAPGHPMESTAALQTLGAFKVMGFGTGGSIVNVKYVDATVNWVSATQSWEYDNEPFWPQQALNFFAYAPTATSGVAITNQAGITITNFTVGANNTQVDLVVASALNKEKEQRTPLTFKHALTQIVFKAMKIQNSKLFVEISDVEIVNVNSKGTFATTATPAAHYPQSYWTPSATAADRTSFNASPGTAPFVVQGIGAVGTTANATAIQTDNNNALLMVPQNFDAWDISAPFAPSTTGGAYIKLTAAIWTTDVSGTILVPLHGTIVPGAEIETPTSVTGANIYIPVASEGLSSYNKTDAPLGQWVPGRRINYIITFGDTGSASGGGGWTEDPTNPGNPPVPVLVPIRFTAELEDWIDQDAPLLTATFTGASEITSTYVNGFTNNLLNDINASPVPKKYAANLNFTSTGVLAGDVTITDPATGGYANSQQFLTGSTVTYSFSSAIFNGKTISMATPAGWTANTTSLATAGSIVLTRSAWLIEDIKESVERYAASATYTSADNVTGASGSLSTWEIAYLANGQTLSIDFPAGTVNPIGVGTYAANWHWDDSSKRATYTAGKSYSVAELTTIFAAGSPAGNTYTLADGTILSTTELLPFSTALQVNLNVPVGGTVSITLNDDTAISGIAQPWAQAAEVITYTKPAFTIANLTTLLAGNVAGKTFVTDAVITTAELDALETILLINPSVAAGQTVVIDAAIGSEAVSVGSRWVETVAETYTFTQPARVALPLTAAGLIDGTTVYLNEVPEASVLNTLGLALEAALTTGEKVTFVLPSNTAISGLTTPSFSQSGIKVTFTAQSILP